MKIKTNKDMNELRLGNIVGVLFVEGKEYEAENRFGDLWAKGDNGRWKRVGYDVNTKHFLWDKKYDGVLEFLS